MDFLNIGFDYEVHKMHTCQLVHFLPYLLWLLDYKS